MEHEILPPSLAIKSMRSSGYRDTAHAIAELIDNSIQAAQDIDRQAVVEVLCLDKHTVVRERKRRRIGRIGVYDNAKGMSLETLRLALQFGNGTHLESANQKGIGKFGMGLPNASISQCRRVDVWSWQGGNVLHTYLDLDQIADGRMRDVPEPQAAEIPGEWRALIRDEIGPHGTLVTWEQLDRVKWKTSRAFLKEAEFLVGRMYRHFISDGRARIRLAAFEDTTGEHKVMMDHDVRPNDPLYLMSGTAAPASGGLKQGAVAFDRIGERVLSVQHAGEEHDIKLTFAVCKPEARDAGGSSALGRHANKNQGVSVVRAGRELEMNLTFENKYDPRERWWGIELSFEPELDEVFGVTNNKQAATNFLQLDLDEDAKTEGMTPGEYREYLEELEDPRLAIYDISQEITRHLNDVIRPQIKRMKEGTKEASSAMTSNAPEMVATKTVLRSREKDGAVGRSDKQEQMPVEQRTADLKQELMSEGVPEKEAEEIAVEYVQKNLKFLFEKAELPKHTMFDISSVAGTIVIKLNVKHLAWDHLFALTDSQGSQSDSTKALKLLLAAWARLEDEAGDKRRDELEDIRLDWGRKTRDFLKEADD